MSRYSVPFPPLAILQKRPIFRLRPPDQTLILPELIPPDVPKHVATMRLSILLDHVRPLLQSSPRPIFLRD